MKIFGTGPSHGLTIELGVKASMQHFGKLRELVLASSSPRRQELLSQAGIAFIVDAPHITELDAVSHPELSAQELALANAQKKAWTVAQRRPSDWVLAADTVVACEGKIFGKPADLDEARAILRALSGKTHQVLTGVCLCSSAASSSHLSRSHVETSSVTFRSLDEPTLQLYLSRVYVLDKAGAYALQEQQQLIIQRIEGSRTNVIGLPMEVVLPALQALAAGK